MAKFTPTPHAVLRLPTPAQAMAMGAEAWRQRLAQREELIRQERRDPFAHGWQPPIWWVCDCLLGFPWVDAAEAEALRQHLGFDQPVRILLINGGNRGGKSQYAANRVMRVLALGDDRRAWALHSNLSMSRDFQQPLLFKYLPPELRVKDIKTRKTYISYKQKTGFSDQKFVLPPQQDHPGVQCSNCLFKTYDQDVGSIEGGNLDVIWPDELVPPNWVETMELRLAERNGWMIITFTPVEGYSETVRLFQDGAVTVRESIDFLSPRDGGPPDLARQLNLTPDQLEELEAAERAGRAAYWEQSRPEDCRAWLRGESGQAAIPEGRMFERVPRVMKCADEEGKRAVVFFHSSDNPYGNPKNVWKTIAGKSREFIQERFFGVATKTLTAAFAGFNRPVHVIAREAVPSKGEDTHVIDPAGRRNCFMLWIRATPEQVVVYREWPDNRPVDGLGVLGPWAVPDGRKPDGRPGPGQKSLGWGLLDYKRQIALAEQWPDALAKPDEAKEVLDWEDLPDNSVRQRLIDSRFASNPKLDRDRPRTLITEFEEVGLFFLPTPGDNIEEGVLLVADALKYDKERPVDFFNRPRLVISEDCPNTIYALQTWTGKNRGGATDHTGACKDPIDCLRYYFLHTGRGTIEEELEPDQQEAVMAEAQGYAVQTARYY